MNKAEWIWTEYSRLMLTVARGFFGDTPEAEDAVSEAMEKILSNLDRFDDAPSPRSRALCSVITKNVCRDAMRRKKAGKNAPTGSLDEEEAAGTVEGAPSAEAVWFSAETVAGVKACIRRLPGPYAEILRLTMVCGMTPAGIARVLGITDTNARVRLARARAALMKLMREEGLL